jgi:hypothetical protein
MKYLITESQLKPLMWRYFNSYEYDMIINDYGTVFLIDDDEHTQWTYEHDGGRLFVANEIIFGFEAMFNVSGDDALEYAGEWFEETYDYKVEEIINWDFQI